MQAGDLMYCTFPCGREKTLCVLIERRKVERAFWNILWNGEVLLMHTDHLVAV